MLVKSKSDVMERAMALGDKHGYYFRAMPNIGVISEPVMVNRWRFVPIEQDNTPLPPEAQTRLNLLVEAGFPIKQVLIGHEPKTKKEKKEVNFPEVDLSSLWTFLRVVGLVLGAVVTVIGYAAITALSLLDPVLIVILEGEERWMLCIATWEE
jgi:hypothetical protein